MFQPTNNNNNNNNNNKTTTSRRQLSDVEGSNSLHNNMQQNHSEIADTLYNTATPTTANSNYEKPCDLMIVNQNILNTHLGFCCCCGLCCFYFVFFLFFMCFVVYILCFLLLFFCCCCFCCCCCCCN